ncbi:ABC transporter ATP-binding protein [Streptomyces sp. 4N509B]|uniref:ABC transporter ATP-binding protein n=1 Tax=Streptomyces sp. 4N509B TaxID=3457413 RepID=UPI003FD1B395
MRLRGVGRRYGIRGPWVLRDVELGLAPGSLTRVVGANGSGKSTLLRLLAGVDAPTVGRVTDRPRAAYVPERFPSELPFTALGYLTHLGRVHGLRGAVAARRGEAWLERFGAGLHARTPLAELSKGGCQRVAVAQALLAEPGLLVLDEAWSGLDEAARGELERAVAERVAAGGAVVFVDHDPGRLAGVTGAVYRVAGGRVAPAAPPARGGSARPRVTVLAEGPPGAALPPGLPDSVAPVASVASVASDEPGGSGGPAAVPGLLRLTVAADQSDALLLALLSAEPPWHVRAVRAEERDA